MRIRTLKTVITASFFICMVAVCVLCCLEFLIGALIALAVEGVFYLIMTALFARCPSCGKSIRKNFLQLDFCPHCQNPLD